MSKNNLALTLSDFLETTDSLYGWSSSLSDKDRLFSAGSNMGSLGVKLHTLNPKIYALWDEGISINAYTNVNGAKELMGTVKYYIKSTGVYLVSLFDFKSLYKENKYKDYEIVGWKSSLPIFASWDNGKYIYSDYLETGSTANSFANGYYFTEKFELEAILKKKISNISYKAIDENGNELTTNNKLYIDRKNVSGNSLVSGYSLLHEVGEKKINLLKNLTVTDTSKKLKYFAVKVNDKFIKIDIENDEIIEDYLGAGNSLVIYAVFDEE